MKNNKANSLRCQVAGVLFAALCIPFTASAVTDMPPDYWQYCATCHGNNGEGKGEISANMKTPPADLTTIAKRNDGKFPKRRIRQIISGTTTEETILRTHGPKDMPVWGRVFRDQDGDFIAQRRIDVLVEFIESLQK